MKTLPLILRFVFLAISTVSLNAALGDGIAARDAQTGYVIQRGDEISVNVYVEHVLQPALGVGDARVDAEGAIRIGGIPESIELAGQLFSAAPEAIRKRYQNTGLTSVRVVVLTRKDRKLLMSFSPRLPRLARRDDASQTPPLASHSL